MIIIIKKRKFLTFAIISAVIACVICIGTVFAFVTQPELEDGAVPLPIVMYHSIRPNKSGQYTVSTQQFEEDLKYFKDNGYNTVTTGDVVNYVENNTPLPDKPIMLTFDDGYYDNMAYALPILQEYGMKAVVFVVGRYSEESTQSGDVNPNYSYLTWPQISELTSSGTFEIGSHTYDMHNLKGSRKGAFKAKGESDAEYAINFANDLNKLQDKVQEVTNTRPLAFAYPFGNVEKNSTEILKQVGFKLTVTSYQGVSNIKQGNPDSLFQLKRIKRTGNKSTSSIFDKVLNKPKPKAKQK